MRRRVAAVSAAFAVAAGAVVLVGGSVGAQSAADAPTGLAVSAGAAAGELAVSWDAHAIATRDYRLSWAPLGEDFRHYRDLTGNAYPTDASYTISGLTPGGQYKVRVKARFAGQAVRASAWTDTVTASAAESVTTDSEGVESEFVFVPTTEPEPLISLQSQQDSATGPVRGNRHTGGRITTDHNWAAGTALSGNLDSARDQDWYRIWLDRGVCYSFDVRGRADWDDYQSGGDYADYQAFAPQSQLTLDFPLLEGVYDYNGRFIYDSQGTDDTFNQATRIRPIRSDFYFVAVAKGSWSGAGGSYDLSAFDYGTTRHCNTLDATRPRRTVSETSSRDFPGVDEDFVPIIGTRGYINVGESAAGVISEPGDKDLFAFNMEVGEVYRITVEGRGSSRTKLSAPPIDLWDRDLNYLYQSYPVSDRAENSVIWDVQPGESERYYILTEQGFGDPGAYRISLALLTPRLRASASEPTGDDFAENAATRGFIVVGDSVTGHLDSNADGDAHDSEDWYRVELIGGTTYRIDMKGLSSDSGTMANPYLQLYDSAGIRNLPSVAFDDDSGTGDDARITYTPDTTRWFYIAAVDFSATPGTYTLTVTEQP